MEKSTVYLVGVTDISQQDIADRFPFAVGTLPVRYLGLPLVIKAYLWSGGDLQTTKAKIAWEAVCKPKQEGGLGFRSLKEANDVYFLKLIWLILSHKDSLWVKWVRTSLLKQGSLWAVIDITCLGSWMWKTILKYREIPRIGRRLYTTSLTIGRIVSKDS
ncbi:hypothetical protein AtNW77_Chr1g0041331 [Arabidopsis thaliana]